MQLTNTPALFALRAIERHGMDVADSLRRLSSGLRMSSARDDAAGLAISERMGSQLRGMQQANRNINDGISLLQTGEGALGTITDIFQRVRELAVQAASDTNNAQDRMAIQLEASALLLEAKRMVEDTNYNGISLLDGSFSSHLQIGANAGDLLQLGIPSIFHVDADGYNPTSIDLTSHADATKALTFLDEQILHIDMVRARMGAMQNRLGYASSNNATMAENLAASRSAILDTDFAAETAQFGDQHAQFGLIPGWGGSQRLVRLMGLRRALDLMFSARWLKADEAQRSACWDIRCGRTGICRGSWTSRCGRVRTRSIPATAPCPRTPTLPRRAPTRASRSSVPPPTCSS